MKHTRSISLSTVVLLSGAILSLAAVSFAVNLASTPFIAVLAAVLMGLVLLIATGFLFWVVRELEHSEDRLRAIVESAHDGIITTDEYGMIGRLNTSTVSMFGYRPGNLIGEHLSVLLSSAHGQREEGEPFLTYLAREHIHELGVPHEVLGLRKDGHLFAMDLSITQVQLGDEIIFTVMTRDVTDRAAAERVLREARDELERRVVERTAELEESNRQLESEAEQRKALIEELQQALSEINTLSGLLPICASCKKIRDDTGYWSQIEVYIRDHSDAEFSHGICPQCIEQLYPEYSKQQPKP